MNPEVEVYQKKPEREEKIEKPATWQLRERHKDEDHGRYLLSPLKQATRYTLIMEKTKDRFWFRIEGFKSEISHFSESLQPILIATRKHSEFFSREYQFIFLGKKEDNHHPLSFEEKMADVFYALAKVVPNMMDLSPYLYEIIHDEASDNKPVFWDEISLPASGAIQKALADQAKGFYSSSDNLMEFFWKKRQFKDLRVLAESISAANPYQRSAQCYLLEDHFRALPRREQTFQFLDQAFILAQKIGQQDRIDRLYHLICGWLENTSPVPNIKGEPAMLLALARQFRTPRALQMQDGLQERDPAPLPKVSENSWFPKVAPTAAANRENVDENSLQGGVRMVFGTNEGPI